MAAIPKSARRTIISVALTSSSSRLKSQFCGCFVAGPLVYSGS